MSVYDDNGKNDRKNKCLAENNNSCSEHQSTIQAQPLYATTVDTKKHLQLNIE